MEAPFVIKFIETKWHDKQTLVSVSESEYSLKLEQTGNNAFSAHTTIYPKVDELGEPAEFGKNRTLRFSGHP
ncbi:hypothetical protein FKL47_25620 [Klebsiella pneumoniae]|nr:hypothetical protein [Klebsiella pneumoniae]